MERFSDELNVVFIECYQMRILISYVVWKGSPSCPWLLVSLSMGLVLLATFYKDKISSFFIVICFGLNISQCQKALTQILANDSLMKK